HYRSFSNLGSFPFLETIYLFFFSNASKYSFLSSPPPYPTIFPFVPITRWHGTTIEKGFLLTAPPTALTAFGFPMETAISLYDFVSPNGIVSVKACQTCF